MVLLMGGKLAVYLGDLYSKDQLVEMYANCKDKKTHLENIIADVKSEMIKLQNDVFVGMIDREEYFGALEELMELLKYE